MLHSIICFIVAQYSGCLSLNTNSRAELHRKWSNNLISDA
uniref:Uncharacterized protein n=1 Tax=Arundo donax TaxID=35708 RepID=A0A0A9EP02_ARUDO